MVRSHGRAEPHLSFIFEHNIVYWSDGPLLSGNWSGTNFRLEHNLYFKKGGQEVTFAGASLAEWQKRTGQDRNSRIANPKFVDADHHNFRLQPGSPALAIGFKPFDLTRAGVYGDSAWVKEAQAPLPPTVFAPEPPSLAIHDDFEATAVSAGGAYVPDGATAYHEGRPELIALTDQTATSGRQSLKVTDVSGLKFAYDPHIVYQPDYHRGTAVCRFALRLEPGAVFNHEWRDQANPYRTGPLIWIENGKLRAADQEVTEIPTGEWVRFEVRAGLGRKADGTWTLTVYPPGKPPVHKTGLPCAKVWKSLNWLGFVSQANHPTAFYLDDIEIINEP